MQPTLIFDLSETLVGGPLWMVDGLAKRLHKPRKVVLGDLGGEALFALLEGRISEAEYWQATTNKADWDISPTDLARMVREQFRKAVPGMPQLLARLKGARLVLLSDHGREWYEYIRAYHGFLDVFEKCFVSFEMRRTKRELDTFRYVISQLDCEADDCVFIDDRQRNIERAKSVGMVAVHFLDAASLGSYLQERGILLDRSSQQGHQGRCGQLVLDESAMEKTQEGAQCENAN